MDLILLLSTCFITLTLGVVVYVRDSRKVHAIIFMVMSLVITLWIVSNYLTNHYLGSALLVGVANRVAYVMGYGIVATGLIFTYFFPVRRSVRAAEKIAIGMLVTLTVALSASALVAGEVRIMNDRVTYEPGQLVYFYLASFLGLVGFIIKNLTKLPSSVGSRVRHQARLILFAFVVSALIGLTLNLIIPVLLSGWHATRFGPFSTVFLAGVIAYTIIKHGLFDIRAAIVRTATYALTLVVVVGLYGVLFLLGLTNFIGFGNFTFTQQIALLTIATVVGVSFPFVLNFFDQVTSKIFYRRSYDTQKALDTITNHMITVKTLDELLEKVAASLREFVGSESITITLTSKVAAQQAVYTTRDDEILSSIPTLTQAYMLAHGYRSVAIDEISNDDVAQEMRDSSIAMISQLRSQSGLVGYVLFGYRLNGSSYTKRDVDFIDIVSGEFAIAIQSMQRFQEIAKFNEELKARIDEATNELRLSNQKLSELDKSKDEFISMASHQLRTPLTAVKGYVSMVLEGDMGKVSDEQRQVLGQAYDSAQRMVFLIGDFLNVSRIQTGKFVLEPSLINLGELAKEEVDQLLDTARTKQITLEYQSPADPVTITADENKLRQVMMNFIDNAIYYSKPGGTVNVQLYKTDAHAVFKVIDTGIGVPKEAQKQLFTKFYRAANARQQRPDGTGIGLYMAKKVIVAHGGAVLFETVEGKGSTFGFKLRLKNDTKQLDKQPDAPADNGADDSAKTN